jgi:hypothetical protein
MNAYLETKKCTKQEVRALRKIFTDWSDDLNNMPLPMSIESAGWSGLKPDQIALMRTVYHWLNRSDFEHACKQS